RKALGAMTQSSPLRCRLFAFSGRLLAFPIEGPVVTPRDHTREDGMSMWHWLVLVILVGGTYGVYRLSRKKRDAAQSAAPSRELGGFLLLLAAGQFFLGPLLGASQLYMSIVGAEQQQPKLLALPIWATYKQATWWTYAVIAAVSCYGGWGLA